ncbi:MAG: hypothetical protein ACP5D7_25270, partial [Limnospira sp.]
MIDVSDLTPQQIAAIEEIVAAFKLVARQEDSFSNLIRHKDREKEELEDLDGEFDWLVADIGVKGA